MFVLISLLIPVLILIIIILNPKTEKKKYLNEDEIQARNNELNEKSENVKFLFDRCLAYYSSKKCQCAFPRYQQIVGINSSEMEGTFKCLDTELLINMSKHLFDVKESNLKDEVINELWICKKCGSLYEYGWSDFSIYLDRNKLKLIELKTESIGKEVVKPISICLGLFGHSYPSRQIITDVSFEEFEKYLIEE